MAPVSFCAMARDARPKINEFGPIIDCNKKKASSYSAFVSGRKEKQFRHFFDRSANICRLPCSRVRKASGRIELTIRNLYDGLEVRRTGKFISAARLVGRMFCKTICRETMMHIQMKPSGRGIRAESKRPGFPVPYFALFSSELKALSWRSMLQREADCCRSAAA